MKLELPDNNASVLFHMGNALQSIAKDLDLERVDKLASHIHNSVKNQQVTKSLEISEVTNMVMATGDKNPINIDASERRYLDESTDLIDTDSNGEDIGSSNRQDSIVAVSDTIDADGLPWDQRIHSSGASERSRTSKNTWRMARKPKDKTDEEWAEYVEGVKTELKALMAIPVTVTHDPNEAPEVVTPPVVIEAPEVVTPPVVIEAPEVVTPPVVDAVVTGPTTFPELMKFITVNNKKLTKESVDEALKAQGLASIALLAARTDLIPQVHAALVKLL